MLQKFYYSPVLRADDARSKWVKPLLNKGKICPWLSWPVILAIVAMICAPFFCVEIPPLVDVPGHTGAAAIEIAAAGSALSQYYTWHWALTPNMGGEVLMHLLGGGLSSGWWTTVIATALSAGGAMACTRALNPRGAYAMGWSLMFVLGFPWVWGFLNFLLASGLALLIFAWTQSMAARSPGRLALLIVGQPVVFFCHAIGGLILPIMLVAASIGKALDSRKMITQGDAGHVREKILPDMIAECWPAGLSLMLIIFWNFHAPAPVNPGMSWDFHGKRGMLQDVLRDQSEPLDTASAILSYVLVVAGIYFRARWSWRQGLPALALVGYYVALPARINGSQAVDVRMLSVVITIVLGLQDWSKVQPRLARAIAWAGAALLAVRLVVISLGFMAYSQDYASELRALDYVQPGTRMFVLDGNSCSNVQWRGARHDTLASLASLKRQVWINKQWSVRGLDMLESRYDPAPGHPEYLSAMIWDPRCAAVDRPGLAQGLAHVPSSRVDYLWLLDTGQPSEQISAGTLIWHWNHSYLYRFHH